MSMCVTKKKNRRAEWSMVERLSVEEGGGDG